MKRNTGIFALLVLGSLIWNTGCGTSEESSSRTEPPTQRTPAIQQSVPPSAVQKTDTVNVDFKTSTTPPYDSRTSVPSTSVPVPTGKQSVQIGAYKMPDNADRVAALARERFGKNVYSILDKASGQYKVYVGDFPTKEEARRFRDEMVQKYPNDYKDAWVSELPPR